MYRDSAEELHIRLSSYEKKALDFMRARHSGVSRTEAVRLCIRASAMRLGFKDPDFASSDIAFPS